MRLAFLAALVAALSVGGCLGREAEEGPAGPPLQPGGYQVILDTDRSDPGHFVTTELPEGVRLTTGPGGIAWRPGDTISSGDFRVEGTFTLHGAPVAYREGYGIFVGGRSLEGPGAEYLYLLVRPNGDFLVRRRSGGTVDTPVEWLSHNAVQRVALDGEEPVNTLAIEVQGEETRLLVNGTVVFIMPTEEAGPYGTAGIRMNHRLDVTLEGWTLGPPPPPAPAPSPP